MRYLVKACVIPGREKALLAAIQKGTLGAGSMAGDEYLRNMRQARVGEDGTAQWIEVCFCQVPLEEERPYWEEFFELIDIKDVHARRNCRDWNGAKPWACCDCDCTKALATHMQSKGCPFLPTLVYRRTCAAIASAYIDRNSSATG